MQFIFIGCASIQFNEKFNEDILSTFNLIQKIIQNYTVLTNSIQNFELYTAKQNIHSIRKCGYRAGLDTARLAVKSTCGELDKFFS